MRHVLLIVATLGPVSALADVPSELAAIDAKLKACTAKDESNVGWKQCTGDAYGAADKVLTSVYRAAVDRLKRPKADGDAAGDGETLKRLIASERAWIAYRDTDCELQGVEMLGGTGEGLVIAGCLFAKTKERAKSLDDLLGSK